MLFEAVSSGSYPRAIAFDRFWGRCPEVHSSGMGGTFGGRQTSMLRKRRGVELLLFQLTVGTSVFFFLVAVANVLVAG